MLDALAARFGAIWLRWLRYPWSRTYRLVFERRYRNAPLPPATTIDEVRQVLASLTWMPDGPRHLYDAISYPGAVWARRRDDCDGYAILAATLLARIDSRSAPLLVTAIVLPVKRAHTVCAFREPGVEGFRAFDNARLLDTRFASLETVARYIARRGARGICWDVVRPADLRPLVFGRLD
jgi:hypothetical protein